MRRLARSLGIVPVAAAGIYLDIAPPATATSDASAINGTYTATSDGRWATTDYAFHEEATVTSTWTITSTCSTDFNCTGQVISDQGWTAALFTHEGHVWYVDRDLPNWQPCSDGTVFPGHQTFKFSPSNADGLTQVGSPYLEGIDKTNGIRGACGQAKWLTIVMPFRLDKMS